MGNNQKKILLLILVILPPIFIILSHEFFPGNYLLSSIYKIIFLAPLFIRLFIKKQSFKVALTQDFSLNKFKSNASKLFLIGLSLSLIYLSSFYIFKNFLDIKTITDRLNELASINLNSIIFIGAYIIIFNSILEEYFWRSFIFEEFSKIIKPIPAFIISATAFSFHHVVFFYNWFSPLFFLLITIGLIGYALIMNFIWQKYRELFSCWLVHAMVDIVQIYIAYQIFA